jgi:hypothetical protein
VGAKALAKALVSEHREIMVLCLDPERQPHWIDDDYWGSYGVVVRAVEIAYGYSTERALERIRGWVRER